MGSGATGVKATLFLLFVCLLKQIHNHNSNTGAKASAESCSPFSSSYQEAQRQMWFSVTVPVGSCTRVHVAGARGALRALPDETAGSKGRP